jgi:hypothetical protein
MINLLQRIKLIWAILKGGVIIMVDVYVALIVHGVRTIDTVPVNLQPAVLAELNAIGLDGYGKPLTTTP